MVLAVFHEKFCTDVLQCLCNTDLSIIGGKTMGFLTLVFPLLCFF